MPTSSHLRTDMSLEDMVSLEKVIPLIQEMFHDQNSPQPAPRAQGQTINSKARVQKMAATD